MEVDGAGKRWVHGLAIPYFEYRSGSIGMCCRETDVWKSTQNQTLFYFSQLWVFLNLSPAFLT